MKLGKAIPDLRGQIEKDGETWDVLIMGEVTCDGTHACFYNMKENVKRLANEMIDEFKGAVISKPGFAEEYHKADMAYGKNVDVVTWWYGLCIRLPEVWS